MLLRANASSRKPLSRLQRAKLALSTSASFERWRVRSSLASRGLRLLDFFSRPTRLPKLMLRREGNQWEVKDCGFLDEVPVGYVHERRPVIVVSVLTLFEVCYE